MSKKQDTLERLKDTGVIAVVRTNDTASLVDVSRALWEGGVCFVEITMTTPGALDVIRECSRQLDGQVLLGAGTVLDAETAQEAILAGAEFIVSPIAKPEVIETAKRHGVVVTPGALTPVEIYNAWEMGADIVKVFPAGSVGGPAYFKDLKGPFPEIAIMPTGGVNLSTAGQYIQAGAFAVGVGGELVGKKLLQNREFHTIRENARQFVAVVKEARNT